MRIRVTQQQSRHSDSGAAWTTLKPPRPFAPPPALSTQAAQFPAIKSALKGHSFARLAARRAGAQSTHASANRTGLPDHLKDGIERLSGLALDDVRVHYNSTKPKQLQALAYTQGTEIHLGPGQEKNLAHEAWHIVQQKQGRVRALLWHKGVGINDNAALEHEADLMGAHAARARLNGAGTQAAASIGAQAETTAHPGRAGHSSLSVAAQPVQRVLALDANKVPEELRKSLTQSIDQFNKYKDGKRNTKEALHKQFGMIDQIERRVNKHLRDKSDSVSDSQRQELFSLLRQTQQQHVDLTERNVKHGHDLWIRNSKSLSTKEHRRRQQLWKSLVNEKGNVKIETNDAGFRNRMHSGFARLLQGAHGSDLLSELNRPQRNADRNIIISDDHTANYARYNKTNDPGSSATGIAYVKHGQDLHSKRQGGPNVGTGSYVQIQPTPPPSLDEYETDPRGKALFSPEFVTLGHELGHARHHLRGTTASNLPEGDDLASKLWTNEEEHVNITGEENPIRAEHDLPQRQYHATIGSARATTHRHNLTAQLNNLWGTVPAKHRPTFGPKSFGPINQALNNQDLSQPHIAQNLKTRIDKLQQDLPNQIWREDVKAQIKTALTPTKPKVLTGLLSLGLGGLWLWNKSRGAQ